MKNFNLEKFKPKKLGKKAFADDTIYWIPKMIYLGIVIIVIMMILITFIKLKFDIFEAESQVYANRVLYSLDSISYYDSTINRVYPGIIDVEKMKDEVLSQSFSFNNLEEKEDTYVAIKVTLNYDDKKVEAYYNKVWYERFLPRISKTGRGGAQQTIEKRNVLVRELDGTIKTGTLTIDVLIPND